MKERGEQGLPPIEGMETVNHRLYNLIGKDMVLQDAKDPLGAKSKSAAEQKEQLDRFKLFAEGRCDIDGLIYDFAQKATNSFLARAKQLKVTYHRLIQFINQCVSETVLKNQPATLPQAQKVRRTLAKSLLSDGWTQEGLAYIEKIKAGLGQNEEDVFFYEMQVLNHDKVLK